MFAIIENLPMAGQIQHHIVINVPLGADAELTQSIKELDRCGAVTKDIYVLVTIFRPQEVAAQ
jgi:hypothetical protein